MSQRSSLMLTIDGVDGAAPRLVARDGLITTLAVMALSDLNMAHDALGINQRRLHIDMEAGELLELLEQHTRAVNALQALLATREPDELVEAHLP
jgi:hypothetical protein